MTRGTTAIAGGAKPLYDYFTFANLYQPVRGAVATWRQARRARQLLAAARSTRTAARR